MATKPVAVQLWTLRNEMAQDLPGTLARVAEIGYAGVELWFPQYPPAGELKAILETHGLQIAGAHLALLDLRDDFERLADYHGALGNKNLVISYIPEELRPDEDAWRQRIDEIATIGRRCNEAGFRLSYHNHAMEFQDKIGGVDAHDVIFATVSPDLLKAELDVHFIQDQGRDPAAYIRRYSGRVPLLHLKERARSDAEFAGTELGRGVIDWDAVFSAAEEAGVEWYIIEQNCQELPALQSIEVNFAYLKAHGIA